jgi:vancomycin permeability regulator SanA
MVGPRGYIKGSLWAILPVLLLFLLGYLVVVARQIERQSTRDEAQRADVILVLGAAQYRGRPSPVLESRLNHALNLFQAGLSPYVMTTGGAGRDPKFTEADVSRAFLIQHAVPSEAILNDPEGSTTAQSVDAAAEIMYRMNLHSCIVVSDGYHIYRVKRLLQARNIQVFGSPRRSSQPARNGEGKWVYLRQAVGFMLWQMGVNI